MGGEKEADLRRQLARRVNDALGLSAAGEVAVPVHDKYRLQCDPQILRAMAELIALRLPADVEVLVGVEVGGIGVAAAIALQTGLPWAVGRRKHGEVHISSVVGSPVIARRAVLVKDAALGGRSLPALARSLQDQGADVVAVAVGMSWNSRLDDVFASTGLALAVALTVDDLRGLADQ